MARGTSVRVPRQLDPALQRKLDAALTKNGLTYKNWLTTEATEYLKAQEQPATPLTPISKTVIALVDFSDVTPQVIEKSLLMARNLIARLILIHVVPAEPAVVELGFASPTLLQPPSERRVESDYNQLLNLRDSLADSGVPVSAQQLEQADIGKLIDLCHNLQAELIVIGTHHHSAIYQFFIGTYTADVIKRAKCPVLVVPTK